MNVCAKFQLPSLSKVADLFVDGVVRVVSETMCNLNPSCIMLELGLGFDKCLSYEFNNYIWILIKYFGCPQTNSDKLLFEQNIYSL